MTRRARRGAVVGAVLVLGLLPQAAGGQTAGGKEPLLTSVVHASNGQDEAPGHSYASPAVVVDPDNPKRVYAATVDVRSQRCALFRSTDGGRRWARASSSPSPDAFPFCTHDNGFIPLTFLAMGRDKALYFAHIGWDTQDGGRSENRSVFLGRTTDGGETWTSTTVRNNRGKTGNDIEKNVPTGLAVDTSGEQDVVYVSWTASFPNPTSPSRPGQPMIATSTDGGRTFGEPVNVSGTYFDDPQNLPPDLSEAHRARANFGGSGVSPTVDGKGNLFVSWTRSTANITPTAPPTALYLSRSSDQGKSFTVSEIQPPDANQFGPTGTVLRWSPKGGDNGSLHAVWEGKPVGAQGDRDVIYRRSTDEGRTWSDAKVLNDDDPALLYGQFQPNLSIAPDGRLNIAWWDMRDSAGRFVTDVYATHSHDSGVTWAKNVRVTDRSIDRTIGVWRPGTGGDVRQPPGIGSAEEVTYFLWDDTRHGTLQTETQDLYAAAAQFKPLAGSGLPRTAGYLLGVIGGVAAVGILLIIGSIAFRGRRGAALPAEPAAGRQEVEVG
ncbi:MAG: hypothetical protein M3203_09145 [Actinomycetota bacterium]|nr:hypothetical protein [Actinomycetota bacterium]